MHVCLLSSFLLASYAAANDILDITQDPAYSGAFSTFITALELTGIDYAFDQIWLCANLNIWCGPDYTVFAPTNDAFDALPNVTLPRLLEDNFLPHLKDLLLYHVVDGEIFSSNIDTDGVIVETLNGEILFAQKMNETDFKINGDTNIVVPDLDANNGVVHVIDKVLLPRSATKNIAEVAIEVAIEAGFSQSTLVSFLNIEGIDLGDFISDSILTIFVPTNDAFDQLVNDGFDTSDLSAVADLLKYHVILDEVFTSNTLAHEDQIITMQGSPISVDLVCNNNYWCYHHEYEIELNEGASITQANILASNGIIHVIDTVLTRPTPPGDIITVASNNSAFSTLVTAIVNASLVNTLQEDGPFTVFAPTKSAFSNAGIDLTVLTADELTSILLYHVISGEVFTSNTLADVNEIVTVQGSLISVDLVCSSWLRWLCYNHEIELNGGVSITQTDIMASNGIIHAIDTVLLPPVL